MKKIRQAIPNEEIAANMRNDACSRRSTRYTRTPTYINEEVAEAKTALVAITFGGIAILALLASIASVSYAMERVTAQPGEIKAKSEMTKQEIKALNIAKAPTEKRHVSK